MANVFQDAITKLTSTQIDFICRTFRLNEKDLMMAPEEKLDLLYDQLCDIEIQECIKAGEDELSETGKIVSDIVTVMGNAIAEQEGYFDDLDEE